MLDVRVTVNDVSLVGDGSERDSEDDKNLVKLREMVSVALVKVSLITSPCVMVLVRISEGVDDIVRTSVKVILVGVALGVFERLTSGVGERDLDCDRWEVSDARDIVTDIDIVSVRVISVD